MPNPEFSLGNGMPGASFVYSGMPIQQKENIQFNDQVMVDANATQPMVHNKQQAFTANSQRSPFGQIPFGNKPQMSQQFAMGGKPQMAAGSRSNQSNALAVRGAKGNNGPRTVQILSNQYRLKLSQNTSVY